MKKRATNKDFWIFVFIQEKLQRLNIFPLLSVFVDYFLISSKIFFSFRKLNNNFKNIIIKI